MNTEIVQVEVIFKKDKTDGEIIAVMPYELSNFRGDMTCFSLSEGHNPICYEYYLECKKAKEKEYKPLLKEMEKLGYKVKVVQRRNYNKWLKEYYKLRG